MPRKKPSCVFCDIVAGKAPAYVVAENELSMCILDINPFAEGHCLVLSKRHVPWWNDLTEDEVTSVFRLARKVARQLKKAFSPEFVGMYARGRRIPHTHIFLVPTHPGDLLDGFFNALERFQVMPPELAALRDGKRMTRTAARIRNTAGA